jgi:hypothetical protein
VADRLQLESVGIKPVRRKTVWSVVGELTRFDGRRGNEEILLVVAFLAAAASLVGTTSARAYGGKAAYQVGLSFNCDNKTSAFCAPDLFGLGGFWGWYAFNSDGTSDAQLTFCSHSQGPSGAFHSSQDGIWTTAPPQVPLFGNSLDFYTSTDGGTTWQVTMVPATAGHYSAKLAPGVSAEVQVAGS